jgi:hypothetical protein
VKPESRIACALLLMASAAATAADTPKLGELAWLAGCWGFERDGKRYEEVWLPPAGDGAIGMARTLKGGRTVNHEFTQLAAGKDGGIAYVANPSGQNRANFPLLKLEGTRAVFENPAHDFPTRVIYAYTAPDRLDARIEGKMDGKDVAIDYPFRRVPCPTAPHPGEHDSPPLPMTWGEGVKK